MILDWATGEHRSVPGTYVLVLTEFAAQHGVDPDRILAPEHLNIEDAMEFDAEFDPEQFNRLIGRAVELTGLPQFGYELARRLEVVRFRLINDIVATAQTLRDAFEICDGLTIFRSAPIQIRKEETARLVRLHFQAEPGTETDPWSIALAMGDFANLGRLLTGRDLEGSARVSMSRPHIHEQIAEHFNAQIEFGCEENFIEFKPEVLDYALLPARQEAGIAARRQIRAALKLLKNGETFGELIRTLVFDESRGMYSMEEIAAKLGFSARTLQRHLSDVDLVFSDIVEDIRQTKSRQFLQEGNLSISQVAALLGYTDVSNFSRAFRRWTGQSPREYQRCPSSEN